MISVCNRRNAMRSWELATENGIRSMGRGAVLLSDTFGISFLCKRQKMDGDYLEGSVLAVMFSTKPRRVCSRILGLSSHSHTVNTLQPREVRSSWFFLSRTIFPLIFCFQKSELVLGHTKYAQPVCPCQKHPFTKIVALYFESTMSGFPGNFATFLRYLKPWEKRYFRTSSSGFVFFP